MTQCRRCRCCEEHCLCTQPSFQTVELAECWECGREDECAATRIIDTEGDSDE